MVKMLKKLSLAVLILGLLTTTPIFAHIFSNTFAELHMDFGRSDEHFDGKHSAGIWTLTLEHYSAFAYGDNFFFVDFASSRNFEFGTNEGSIYLEYAPRLSINKIACLDRWDSFISEIYLSPQLNYGYAAARYHLPGEDNGAQLDRFPIGPIFLIGPSLDLNIPGIQVLNVSFLYRYHIRDNDAPEPVNFTRQYDDNGFQFTLVWGAKVGNIFESPKGEDGKPTSKAGEVWCRGFLDYWNRGEILNDRGTLLTEPQLYFYFTNELALGTEIEVSYNFAGSTRGTRHFEVNPTVFLRFDF